MSLTITGWSFDQSVYNPGAVVTLTIDYTSTDSSAADVSSAVTVTVSDATSGAVTQASNGSVAFPDFTTAGAASADPTTVTVSDNRPTPGTWTQVSNTLSGTAAPFSGVAVFTSVA